MVISTRTLEADLVRKRMNVKSKPYSQACDNNKEPILIILRTVAQHSRRILEIGSGTGQHAVYLGKHLPHLIWHTSDLRENHDGILAWLEEAHLENVLSPLHIDVENTDWHMGTVDGIFSANTAHIMSWSNVVAMFAGVKRLLEPQGFFCLYGPFNYNGTYTNESNAHFDAWLKTRDPLSGIRDFEAVNELACGVGLALEADHPMPANNRTLVWRKLN